MDEIGVARYTRSASRTPASSSSYAWSMASAARAFSSVARPAHAGDDPLEAVLLQGQAQRTADEANAEDGDTLHEFRFRLCHGQPPAAKHPRTDLDGIANGNQRERAA